MAVDFEEVINNPSKFDKKRVTLVAMAEVGGDRFYLYRPPKPALSKAGSGREIYGILRTEGPVYDRFNDKLVEVTGVVDANYRGLVSDNACGLIIERVRLAGKVEKPKLSCGKSSCLEIKLSQLAKNPKTYESKCVCIIGFAHIRGDAFVIYESEKAAEGRDHPDFTKGVFVSPASGTANYDRYNKQWIKIRGLIDLTQRGFDDYPAGIVAEDVQSALPQR